MNNDPVLWCRRCQKNACHLSSNSELGTIRSECCRCSKQHSEQKAHTNFELSPSPVVFYIPTKQ